MQLTTASRGRSPHPTLKTGSLPKLEQRKSYRPSRQSCRGSDQRIISHESTQRSLCTDSDRLDVLVQILDRTASALGVALHEIVCIYTTVKFLVAQHFLSFLETILLCLRRRLESLRHIC